MNLKPFLSWCASRGISSSLDVKLRPDGSRFVVLKDSTEMATPDSDPFNLLQCPLSACLTGLSNEELADTLFLEKELGDDSLFAPYINILPKEPPDLPRFWSLERFETVTDGGNLQAAVKNDEDRYNQVKDPWCLAMVDSRANILPGPIYSLTPLLDLINHDATVQTSAEIIDDCLNLNVAADSVQQKPTSLLGGLFQGKQQPELRISYGDLPNLESLLNYGFVATNNPTNTELLSVDIYGRPKIVVEVQSNGGFDTVSLSMIRKALATPEEETEGSLVSFISDRNEMDMYALLFGFLEESICEAKEGAKAVARSDSLVHDYLSGRAATLEKALSRIDAKYPALFG